MQDVISLDTRAGRGGRLRRIVARSRALAPTRAEALLAAATTLLLTLSFPDFDLWPLAWVALAPLAVAVVRAPVVRPAKAFLLGWAFGAVFFYATCYWLTHAFIHYGGIPAALAYVLLAPGPAVVALFPALWAWSLARLAARRGAGLALLCAPFLWAALAVACVVALGWLTNDVRGAERPSALVVGVQPDVPVDYERRYDVIESLMERHLSLGAGALREWEGAGGGAEVESVSDSARLDSGAQTGARADVSRLPRVIVWPESPMNFHYSRDAGLRATVAEVARENHASVIFNAMEPAPSGGIYNSAVMVNEEGRLVAQYDKIRLLPFGEYVPVPRWLPAVWFLNGVVGDFTPGSEYPLMPLGDARAGVFICFESAFPSIAQRFADEGADVLVNISNDGYLGRTPVIRQHLANVVFRAVETGRPVVRVTNTGVSAFVTPRGEVRDATAPFETAARAWAVGRAGGGKTFYTRQGDLFALLCACVGAVGVISTFNFGRAARRSPNPNAARVGRRRKNKRRSFR